MLRRHELVQALPGVYVNHNGPLTLQQREWVAVLARWPAALARESALGLAPRGVIHLAVDRDRQVGRLPGVEIHRVAGLDRRVDWRTAPPRIRVDDAVIDTMIVRLDADDTAGAFALLAEACFRRTNAERVARALAARGRVRHRRLITELVEDRRTGACSVLERGYLQRVERAHGLPRGERQVRSSASGRSTSRDVTYEEFGLVVELDGSTHFESYAARDADAHRDLGELAQAGALTARVTYGLVFGGQCATARSIAAILRRLGWIGELDRCPRCP
ncbi:hypothetical protein F0U44_12360 [Nocardioides humilatus]|uniref:DUF559 domain-containing protein n=2 Tax=Nocardioides humilatus TaxID=2607660 RepID=A0A5B1LG18_9ACTN|nr:hypothetical protein F0U44_12360 [Nocardioides humilatus]